MTHEIFGTAYCSISAYTQEKCEKPYTKWCKGCNLVFCDDHLDRRRHNCKNFDVRTPTPPDQGELL
jgi:predicted RNA-binding protein with PUA domain